MLGWLDNTPPTGALILNSGMDYTTQLNVSVGLGYSPDSEQVRFRENCALCVWSPWFDVGPAFNFSLSSGDGLKRVTAELKDVGANTTQVWDEITLDTTAPSGSFSIVEASPTNQSPLHLSILAGDTLSGMGQMRFSEQADFSDTPGWQAYAAAATFTPAAGDGLKTVYAQFRDLAGNVTSAAISAQVTLDQTAPSGVLYINGGAAVATQPGVTLSLAASDNLSGPSQMRFNSTSDFTGVSWLPYNPVSSYSLPGGDGPKTVYAQVRDAAGNPSTLAIQAGILLDSTPPSGSVTLSAKPFASAPAVNLALAGGDAAEMRLSNSSTFPGADATWVTFAASQAWTLSGPDGPKTVYAQFRDSHGNPSAVFSDSTLLDTTGPTGQLYVNGNAALTALRAVKLFTTFSETGSGVSEYRAADTSGGLATATWLPLSNPADYTLPAGDGVKTVWIQLRDAAGNLSEAISDTITLDSTAPGGSVLINSGDRATFTRLVALSLNATDLISPAGQLQMQVSNDSGFAGALWQAYQPGLTWTLPAGLGTHTVYVRFRDAAGNISTAVSDTISVETPMFLPIVSRR